MPYRKFTFAAGAHYHIFNRGNNRQDVFLDRDNYILFLRLLRKHLIDTNVVHLLAYCLMPNHYHLFVLLKSDDLSRHMQALLLAYTKSVNHRYGRTGSLFQGRFKGVLVEREAHWRYLSVYIHRNPIEAGLARTAEEWQFSSHRDYLGLRRGTLVEPGRLWEGTAADYRRFVEGFGAVERKAIEKYTIE